MTLVTLACALAFAAVHMLTPAMTFVRAIPRSRWLSLAGGVAVAYVFLHLLPELAEHQRTLSDEASPSGVIVYVLALAGLVAFYGLERKVRGSRADRADREGRDEAEEGTFWLHIGSFSLYNMLIGYLLLHREEASLLSLALYFTAMALHFFTNDFGLHQDHRRLFDSKGRWILSGAVLLGWLLGALTDVSESVLISLFAVLAGGVVLNVLKEELQEERKSRFTPFFLGTAGYGLLLAAL